MALEVKIKKRFGKFELNIDFCFDQHCLGILGASGCGKSLMLKCIAGIETPDEGRIVMDGEVLYDSAKKINLPPQKRRVGYLFQNYALFPNMTVLENIGVGIHVKDKAARRAQAMAYIKKFQLEGLEGHYPVQLSGGQQQRVALARMLAAEPEMILLDEPFSALDAHLKDAMHREMMKIIDDYKGCVVVVSHSRDEIYKLCRHLAIMDTGCITQVDLTGHIFDHPGTVHAARLTGCKNISPIEKVDDHHVRALEWGMVLETAQVVSETDTHVGIRAYHIEHSDGSGVVNEYLTEMVERIEAPFEVQHLLRVKGDASVKPIWWKSGKDKINYIEETEQDIWIKIRPQDVMPLKV